MKKVLLIILAGMFAFGSALAQPSFTVGLGLNHGVFAGEGREENFNDGSLNTVTEEYGAFTDSFASVYVEVGNEVAAIGISYQGEASTPTNINEANGDTGSGIENNTQVSADFSSVTTIYGLVNLPMGMYAKVGIVSGDIEINETLRSGNSYADQDLEGYVAGFGYQHEADAANIRVELLGHTYDDVEANNGVSSSGNLNKVRVSNMIGATAQISVNRSF